MSKLSKHDMILAYMQKGNAITQGEALAMFWCGRLASRICDIKEAGYAVDSKLIKVLDRDGKECRVAQYRLIEKQEPVRSTFKPVLAGAQMGLSFTEK